jgi:hypothetical protein
VPIVGPALAARRRQRLIADLIESITWSIVKLAAFSLSAAPGTDLRPGTRGTADLSRTSRSGMHHFWGSARFSQISVSAANDCHANQ